MLNSRERKRVSERVKHFCTLLDIYKIVIQCVPQAGIVSCQKIKTLKKWKKKMSLRRSKKPPYKVGRQGMCCVNVIMMIMTMTL